MRSGMFLLFFILQKCDFVVKLYVNQIWDFNAFNFFYINATNNDMVVFIILFDHLDITVMADWAFKVIYIMSLCLNIWWRIRSWLCGRTFNTTVDIRLKQWADVQLPKKCVEVSAVLSLALVTAQKNVCGVIGKQPQHCCFVWRSVRGGEGSQLLGDRAAQQQQAFNAYPSAAPRDQVYVADVQCMKGHLQIADVQCMKGQL